VTGATVTSATHTVAGDALTVHWKDGAREVKVQS
jgi:hypothetical protein